MTHADRIAKMIEDGAVTPEQGAELLRSVSPSKRPGWRAWLFDPIEHVPTSVALAIGVVVMIASVAVAVLLGVRFDGAFDMHLTRQPVPLRTAGIDQLVAWPLTVVVAQLSARVAKAKPRWVDLIAAVGLARVVILLTALIALLLPIVDVSGSDSAAILAQPGVLAKMILVALLVLPFTIYFFVILVRSYRTVTDLHGAPLWASVIAWVIIAEAVSKVVLYALA